ncbi:MAG: transglycosylase SLT domain-containing protein [Vicinamibacterales bacterium]
MKSLSVVAVVAALAVTVSGQVRLVPTSHPPVPADLSAMWYAPSSTRSPLSPALDRFVTGVKLIDEQNNAAAALPLVGASALASTPLADYARYYTGLALLKLDRYDAADNVFAELAARPIDGHLPEDSSFRQAEVREARQDYAGALVIYESLIGRKLAQPHVAWMKLGLAADAAGNRRRAIEALEHVYYDYPLSPEADEASGLLTRFEVTTSPLFAPREFARGETLFKARRWNAAKASFERSRKFIDGPDLTRLDVHLAACLVATGHASEGRDTLKPLLDGPMAEEAGFHYLTAVRALKQKDEHARLVRAFVDAHPASPWAEDALNGLASALIIDDKDDEADAVFREILDRFPTGRFAERAAWKSGWWAYRKGRFEDARQLFDRGAAAFPRSDYRPSWLYWSGKSAEQLGNREVAIARLKLTATDYHNSYYGRLALTQLSNQRGASVPSTVVRESTAPTGPAVPTAGRIQLLLATGLNREALGELQYAQRMWGDSPQLQATLALTERLLGNVRAGINAMKRAYPQYLAAGGESLPTEILQVIFPVDYWPLLQKYAAARSLDPYLVAALVAQESNFDPAVKSGANAIGLMQVLPSTARSYARRLGIKPFSARRLTEAEVNVMIGTNIFYDTIKKFGGVHFALAAYNAGDSRVASWQRERPGLPQDEFIDDIPFPETQNYVKRILGTAEDYRKLYGPRASR